MIGIQFGVLLGGAIVDRDLFALPGVGRLIVTAINQRNYTVVQGGVLVVATLFILVTLAHRRVVGLVDPRIEEGQTRMSAIPAPLAGRHAEPGRAIRPAEGADRPGDHGRAGRSSRSSRRCSLRTIRTRSNPAGCSAGLSLAHPFGSDALGRDVLSRVIFAFRVSLSVAVGSVAPRVPRRRPARADRGLPRRVGRHGDHAAGRHAARAAGAAARDRADRDRRAGQPRSRCSRSR